MESSSSKHWDKASTPHTHNSWPNRDGTLEPKKAGGQSPSRTFAKYGDFKQGRGLQELQVCNTGPMSSPTRRLGRASSFGSSSARRPRSVHVGHYYEDYDDIPIPPRSRSPRPYHPPPPTPASPAMAWRNQYGAPSAWRPASTLAAPRSRVGMVTRVPARLEGGTNPGELEVLVGWPQWMPGGASTVFVTAECDDGAIAASEHLHSDDHLRSRAAGWRDGLGGAFVLTVRDARSVTLHVMAEDAARPWLAPRSLGGTTIMLPEPDWTPARTRIELVTLSLIPTRPATVLPAPDGTPARTPIVTRAPNCTRWDSAPLEISIHP